jgi:hypothetical protein
MTHRTGGVCSPKVRLSAILLAAVLGLAAFSQMACPTGKVRKPAAIQSEIKEKEQRRQQIENELRANGCEYDPQTGKWTRGYLGVPGFSLNEAVEQHQALVQEHADCRRDLENLNNELQRSQSTYSRSGADVSRRGAAGPGGVNVPAGGKPPCTGHTN